MHDPETTDPTNIDYFDYDLLPEAIAQTPVEPRDSARMLVSFANQTKGLDRRVDQLADELQPGDVVVVNDTKVLAARLNLFKVTGGAVEVLLLEPTGRPDEWQALVRPSKRVPPGAELFFDGTAVAKVGEALDDGRRLVTLLTDDVVDVAGQVPLPPYITTELTDPDRYQTVFANQIGSVAAPTAGLHFTSDSFGQLAAKGIAVVSVELQVGLGTFRPITADNIADHQMHAESYHISEEAWQQIRSAKRVVAVGTTVVRTLESAAKTGQLSGRTELFITRGFDWQVIDVLLTNFHVPKSSLLVLVDSFIGSRWVELYNQALAANYRFLSFGDCMLLERNRQLGRNE